MSSGLYFHSLVAVLDKKERGRLEWSSTRRQKKYPGVINIFADKKELLEIHYTRTKGKEVIKRIWEHIPEHFFNREGHSPFWCKGHVDEGFPIIEEIHGHHKFVYEYGQPEKKYIITWHVGLFEEFDYDETIGVD